MTSEFPHGYSLSMGRTLFYYSEYIANQILTPSMANQMDILLTNKITNGEQVIDFKFDSLISEEKIKSMVLDIFDFDFEGFNKRLESYDLCDDIKKPTESKPWLVMDKHPNDLLVL
jgi:S-adenosylmethionine synthetase